MKNIIERAKEWSEYIVETTPYDVVNDKLCIFDEDRDIADVAKESYIKGARDQKAIDLDKSCNIFCQIGCPHKRDSYDCLTDKCDTWKIFRKMMEE